MGKDMAARTQPVKLKFRKTPDKSKQFTLEIACNSAEATMLQYRIDLILEKLSMIVGAGVVTAIRFVPVTSNPAKSNTIKRPNKTQLDPTDENFLRKTLENVEDPDIQEKLKNLGASLLQDRKNKAPE